MDILDKQGKPVHYSGNWERVTFTNGTYRPGRSFRLYLEAALTLTVVGTLMKRTDAFPMDLDSGYHNIVCQEIIESGSSSPPDGAIALF